ncbi:MAG: hypothetical protein EA412_07130 [Chitinophagaceae bacterium]|nr:MAG: hypothetical protein EA412_07130 [Chitinophagaceae bacterium]
MRFILFFFTIFFIQLFEDSGSPLIAENSISVVEEELIPLRALLRLGNRDFRRENYYDAIDYFEKALEQDEKNTEAIWKIGLAHFKTRNFIDAAIYFDLLEKITSEDAESELPFLFNYKYGVSLLRQAKYNRAIVRLTNFKNSEFPRNKEEYKLLAENNIQNCLFAMSNLQDTLPYSVESVGENINAPYTEFAPFVLGDSVLFYSSINIDSNLRKAQFGRWTYTAHLYRSKIKASTYSPGQLLPQPVNEPGIHSGHGSFTPDGKRFYFTRCVELPSGRLRCRIFRTTYENNTWQEPEKLNDHVNNIRYTLTDPSVTTDRQGRDVLFFASDRPGGKGGLDIWYSVISQNGVASEAKNLGAPINTAGNERSPYVKPGTNTLYFSSDGHPGFGGFDLFKTDDNWLRWTQVENLGLPFNSPLDDMYFVKGEDANTFYIVSNRPGTMSLRGLTCCDDIFKVERKPATHSVLVLSASNQSDREALESFVVSAHNWETTELMPKKMDTAINEILYLTLEKGKDYRLEISKSGFLPQSTPVFLSGNHVQDSLYLDFYLEPLEAGRTYSLSNIYFEYNEYELNETSKEVLDELYELLKENPDLKVELSSHTDNIGSDAFNQSLSQKRAESCVNYLLDSGIDKDRLIPKGYGSEHPVAPNQLEDGSDNPDGRKMNRRTEFKILE